MSVDLWILSLAIIGSCLTQLGDHPGETEAVRARLSPAGHQQLLAAATQVSPRCHPGVTQPSRVAVVRALSSSAEAEASLPSAASPDSHSHL